MLDDVKTMQRYPANSFSNQNHKVATTAGTPTPIEDCSDRFKAQPVQLTTWTHEPRYCTDEVVVDLDLLPAGTKEGDVAELRTLTVARQQKVLFVVKKPPPELLKIVPNLQVR